MTTTIIARPLTKAEFAPYGTVIEPYDKEEQTSENCFFINKGYAFDIMRLRRLRLTAAMLASVSFVPKSANCLSPYR